jgi:hypothetical protein
VCVAILASVWAQQCLAGLAPEHIVEPHGLVRDEFGEDVGGNDHCERAQLPQRVLRSHDSTNHPAFASFNANQ